ncbi:MAG: hypothetical protein LC792_18270 [Actinobacteria bacterium]|nr:hypothetical protein [Actinomycetota bacterium]
MYHRTAKTVFAIVIATLGAGSGIGLTPTSDAFATGTCTNTVTGAHSGTMTLSGPGVTCLRNATQDGAITVTNGHELSVVDSKITGAVTSTSNAPFTFCHSSTVRGAIKVSNSTNPVVIGDNGACAANVIDGAVTLDANKGGTQLAGNSIGGAVTASQNVASSGPVISNNHIGGMLTCSGNSPAPVNNGQPNTVSGDRVGQTCADGTF